MADKVRFIDLTSTQVPDGISDTNMTRNRYLSSICNTEFLSNDEVTSLINRLRTTKNETEKTNIKNKILISYQPLIFSLATKYATKGNQMDYVSEASIKFLSALDSYDLSKGSLSTYMINCIAKHFATIYNDNNGAVHVPIHSWDAKKLRRLVSRFVNENEREPSDEELVDMCIENGIDTSCLKDKVHENVYIPLESIENDKSEDKRCALNRYTDKLSTTEDYSFLDKGVITSYINEYSKKYVKTIKSECTKRKFIRNVEMVMDYFGINDGEQKTYSYLAEKYRIHEETARICIRDTVKTLSEILPREQLCA